MTLYYVGNIMVEGIHCGEDRGPFVCGGDRGDVLAASAQDTDDGTLLRDVIFRSDRCCRDLDGPWEEAERVLWEAYRSVGADAFAS